MGIKVNPRPFEGAVGDNGKQKTPKTTRKYETLLALVMEGAGFFPNPPW